MRSVSLVFILILLQKTFLTCVNVENGQPLLSSRVNALNFSQRILELEKETNFNRNGFSEEFEVENLIIYT